MGLRLIDFSVESPFSYFIISDPKQRQKGLLRLHHTMLLDQDLQDVLLKFQKISSSLQEVYHEKEELQQTLQV